MEKERFIHSCCNTNKVVNFDTFLSGMGTTFYGGYGAVVEYYYTEGFVEVNENLNRLCFVHGNVDELKAGKKCVVRDEIMQYDCTGKMDENGLLKWDGKRLGKAVIHLKNGHVILAIGTTPNGNTVIVMK